jgi:hypothetical protein
VARCVIGRVAAIRPQLDHKPTWRIAANIAKLPGLLRGPQPTSEA